MKRSLSNRERLKKRQDIAGVFKTGNDVSTRGARLRFRRNGLDCNRVGITLTRKFGNAVRRNTAKRRAREIYRNMKPSIRSGYDMMIILYPGSYSFEDRQSQLTRLFRQASLCNCQQPFST
jgi:ribonuclease P protein component